MQNTINLLEKKRRIENTPAVGDLLNVLKERLTETNLNLRAKVLIAIDHVIKALGTACRDYASLLLPNVLRLTGETKTNVLDALYALLTTWVGEDTTQQSIMFSALVPYLPEGLKAPKGRQRMLTWLNTYATLLEDRAILTIASLLLDCMTSKDAQVRLQAQKLLETATKLVPRSLWEQHMKGRPSPDVTSLRNTLDGLYKNNPFSSSSSSSSSLFPSKRSSDMSAMSGSGMPSMSTPVPSMPAGGTDRISMDSQDQRKQALAGRTKAQVLGKPRAGESLKARLSNVKSSIPKPMPRVPPSSSLRSSVVSQPTSIVSDRKDMMMRRV